MVRAVAVPPNLAFLVISTRIGLAGNRKVYSEALFCTRNGCRPLKKNTTKEANKQKIKKTNYHQNLQNKMIAEATIHRARRCS